MKIFALAAALPLLVAPSATAVASPTQVVAPQSAAVVHADSTAAARTKLKGKVGPGFTISLKKGSRNVVRLKKGDYEIRVSDRSSIHNFRLKGPGVNKATSVRGTGTVVWKVTLKKGRYTYVCDPHPQTMRKTFTVV